MQSKLGEKATGDLLLLSPVFQGYNLRFRADKFVDCANRHPADKCEQNVLPHYPPCSDFSNRGQALKLRL